MSLKIQFLPLSLIFLYRRRQAFLLPSLPMTSFRLCRSRHISVHHSTINVRRLKAFSPHQDFQRLSLFAHFRQIFDQDRCSQPADIKGLLRAIRSGFFRRFSFARFEHRHGSSQAPRSGYFSRWRMTSNFRKTSQACGSMSQLRLSSIADQARHVYSSTSTHPHSHQALHSTSKRSRLRAYVKGNSSFHFNISHSTPTRIPDRRQSSRPDFRTFTSESEA